MFSHRSHESAVHVTLTTESNSSLSMTPGHYLWVTKGDNNRPAIVRAGDVQAGDMVWALEDPGLIATRSYLTKITSTTCSKKAGLYNPHTPSGYLVVNNLMALTFTETLPASLTWHSVVTMPAQDLIPSLAQMHRPISESNCTVNILWLLRAEGPSTSFLLASHDHLSHSLAMWAT